MECGVVCVCVLACREKWKAARFEQVTIAVEQTTQNQLLFFFCVRAVMTMLNALRPWCMADAAWMFRFVHDKWISKPHISGENIARINCIHKLAAEMMCHFDA